MKSGAQVVPRAVRMEGASELFAPGQRVGGTLVTPHPGSPASACMCGASLSRVIGKVASDRGLPRTQGGLREAAVPWALSIPSWAHPHPSHKALLTPSLCLGSLTASFREEEVSGSESQW